MKNFISILKEKSLIPKGERIGGYNEETVSFSEILSDYLMFYGNVIIEFITKRLLIKNEIYFYKYEVDDDSDDFYDMPFWEAEWRAKEVKFEYKDINKIYFLIPHLLTINKFLQYKNIKFEVINPNDLLSYSEVFFINKYKERIKLLRKEIVV